MTLPDLRSERPRKVKEEEDETNRSSENRDLTGGSSICWIGICWNVGNGGLAPPSLGLNPHAADLGGAAYVN